MYKIVISKQENNPDFEEQVKYQRDNIAYGRSFDTCPQRYVDVKILDTTVTDEEFNVIRKACIETM